MSACDNNCANPGSVAMAKGERRVMVCSAHTFIYKYLGWY